MSIFNPGRAGFLFLLLALFWGTAAALIWWPGKPTPAPDVALQLTDGRQLRLSELRPKVVVLNFWASSCAICIREFPALQQLWHDYRQRGVEVIGVNMFYDSPANAMRLVKTVNIEFPVMLDITATVAGAFGPVKGTPTTVVIDGRGQIRQYTQGRINFADLRHTLDAVLAVAPPPAQTPAHAEER